MVRLQYRFPSETERGQWTAFDAAGSDFVHVRDRRDCPFQRPGDLRLYSSGATLGQFVVMLRVGSVTSEAGQLGAASGTSHREITSDAICIVTRTGRFTENRAMFTANLPILTRCRGACQPQKPGTDPP